jgi:hypothetical protein
MTVTMFRPFRLLAITSLLANILSDLPGEAQTYDPRTQFSVTANPNGVWTYGYGSTLGGPMTKFTITGNNQGVLVWDVGSVYVQPAIGYNPTGSTITSGGCVLNPNALCENPVLNGNSFTTIRFTAPAAGLYNLSGSFYGMDNTPNGTTTQGHILLNGVSLLSGAVNGFGPGTGPAFDMNQSLVSGDYLDFAVTYPGPGEGDTGLALVLTVVPEPSAFAFIGLGAALLIAVRRK